ncbi:GNAT family N-acetyltransferase [Fulvivirgaceae bacterium PWU5]|uniref:GNAT family N-acetyltransferase n=1 Tax=Dawidia cretensis TaxID=2782350 RepID=A0AAP2E2H5_9BACT|nr:GNAT family N-acetyltransferase [Dawidia cretensis]MBT1710823.1 GNAT family N-acetyltransferase [Dawidia cretensis]
MKFRNATLQDLPQIVAIYNTTVPGRMVTADTEPVTVESRVKWFEDFTPDRRPLWIVEDDAGTILGWVSIKSFYGRPAYNGTTEIAIYLDPAARGKGYGKKILEEATTRCRALGVSTLLGFIFAHNEPSIRLFQGAGFTQWGLFPDVAVLDGVQRSLAILGKRIDT